MPITRTFLNWNQPALPAVVEYLIQNFTRRQILDLGSVVLVLPGGRAGRRLLELLVERADADSLVFLPPEICTVGILPERLYVPKRPFASTLLQHLTWVQAIKDIGHEEISPYLPQLPAEDDLSGWMNLARLLWRQHRELAADALDFEQVAARGNQVSGFQESDRWQLFSRIQKRYLALLDELGLWDLQTARLIAIKEHECQTDKAIILVATADINQTMRLMLDQVSDRVIALVHAPPDIAARFDAHGCLVPEAWQDVTIDLRTEQIQVADGPDERADATARQLASYGGRYRADEIVIGILDDRLVPPLERRLTQSSVPTRWVVGKTLPEAAPYRLLAAIADYVRQLRFSAFAALVRHTDVYAWIDKQKVASDWLTRLDAYRNEHLQPVVGQWLDGDQDNRPLKQIESMIHGLIDPLREGRRSLPAWSSLIASTLSEFYEGRILNPESESDHYTLKALDALREALLDQQQIPAAIAPTVSACQAMEITLQQLQSQTIPPPMNEHAVELLGWLELPLDTAPALTVTSMNESFVPTSVNSDLFLPNALRRQLGLLDNTRRYARDAYALSVLVATRPELTLIVGRRTGEGDPLVPSRLLFATDDTTMAERAIVLFGSEPPVGSPNPVAGTPASPELLESKLFVPKPRPLEKPIESISVTAFRSYLACHYRFYLRHALYLESLDDVAEELDARAFGIMIHEVLGAFGDASIKDATDERQIRHFLNDTLNQYVTTLYGAHRLPAVEVQVAQARTRLDAFAVWQAEWAKAGWTIKHVETTGGGQDVRFPVASDKSLILRGRIDRIDYNQTLDEWAILDYKTGDTPKTPQQTHLKSGEWIDLQLPLYRKLVKPIGVPEDAKLGYIVLPRDVNKIDCLFADWDAVMLQQADAVARRVIEGVLNQDFWRPTVPPPNIMTDYAVICQDHAFRPRFECQS